MKKEKDTFSPQTSLTTRPTRRRVLGAGIAGAVSSLLLPDRWISPVVQVVSLPAHAATSPSCVLRLDGCEVTCESGDGLPLNYYQDFRLYTLEVQDGCPRVADEQTYCCEYDSSVEFEPGPNQILVTCVQYSFEVAPTGVRIRVTLPEQTTPYAEGEADCPGPDIDIPSNEYDETIEIEGVLFNVHTELIVGSGIVTLSQVEVTPV